MKTAIIEATNGPANWGKFLVGVPTEEWKHRSVVDVESRSPLLRLRAWSRLHIWVLDLETGEGAYFLHGGKASTDLRTHQIWVCPLFEPFLQWLFDRPMDNDPEGFLDALPSHIDLPDAEFAFSGYRRGGPDDAQYEDPTATRRALGEAPGLKEMAL